MKEGKEEGSRTGEPEGNRAKKKGHVAKEENGSRGMKRRR